MFLASSASIVTDGSIDWMIIGTSSAASGSVRDHHVDADDRQGAHGVRQWPRGPDAVAPDVAEAERRAEAVEHAGVGPEPRPRDRVEDRQAPCDDRHAHEQDGRREDSGRGVAPLARRLERQRYRNTHDAPKPINSVVITIPTTPTTIVQNAVRARKSPAGRIGNSTSASTQNDTPITANAAHATKAPSPCAVMIA